MRPTLEQLIAAAERRAFIRVTARHDREAKEPLRNWKGEIVE